MPKIYRVENLQGHGPYRNTIADIQWEFRHSSTRHPTPMSDKEYSTIGQYFDEETDLFGFPTLKAYRSWFNKGMREWLHAKGFTLSVYQGRIKARSDVQCIFCPTQVTLLEVLDIT